MIGSELWLEQSMDVFNSRDFNRFNTLTELKKRLVTLKIDDCLLLIDNNEPVDCYNYLEYNKYYYQTLPVSKNEVLVFIGYI